MNTPTNTTSVSNIMDAMADVALLAQDIAGSIRRAVRGDSLTPQEAYDLRYDIWHLDELLTDASEGLVALMAELQGALEREGHDLSDW